MPATRVVSAVPGPRAVVRVLLAAILGFVIALGGSATANAAAVPSTSTFQNLATGFVLDSNFRGDVYAIPGNGGPYQKWRVVPTSYGAVTVQNVATGRCLDSNTSRQVYTLNCNGGSFQKWVITDNSYGTKVLRNVATGFVLDSNANRQAYTMGYNGGSYQKWFANAA